MSQRRARDEQTGTAAQRQALAAAMRNPVSVRYSVSTEGEDSYHELTRTIASQTTEEQTWK